MIIIQDGFGVCSDVPAILHFGDTVAVFILTKNVLLLFVRKIHEATPNAFLDITPFFVSYVSP